MGGCRRCGGALTVPPSQPSPSSDWASPCCLLVAEPAAEPEQPQSEKKKEKKDKVGRPRLAALLPGACLPAAEKRARRSSAGRWVNGALCAPLPQKGKKRKAEEAEAAAAEEPAAAAAADGAGAADTQVRQIDDAAALGCVCVSGARPLQPALCHHPQSLCPAFATARPLRRVQDASPDAAPPAKKRRAEGSSDAEGAANGDASGGEGNQGTAAKAFQRVKADEWLGKKGSWDNSYVGTFGQDGWGFKAQQILGQVGDWVGVQ